jgi:hypothetical protein
MGDADLRAVQQETDAGSWSRLQHILAHDTDHGRRRAALKIASRAPGRPAWIEQLTEREPENGFAWLVRGMHTISWAWEIRTGHRAEHVAQDVWPIFHERLRQADQELAEAARLLPDDPLPLAESFPIVMGLQLGPDELWQRFAHVVQRDRWNYDGHTAMIQPLAPKWGGTEAQMMEFARTTVDNAPTGDPVHAVAAWVFAELWLEHDLDELRARSDVRDLINDAHRKSVSLPTFENSLTGLSARTDFSFAFALLNMYDELIEQAEHIGPRLGIGPWQYAGKNPWVPFEAELRRAHAATRKSKRRAA